jgi:hypothetical protein
LVEIYHQFHVITDSGPDGMNCGQIVARAIAAKPQLQRSEASFVTQHGRLCCYNLRRRQRRLTKGPTEFCEDRVDLPKKQGK